MKPINVQYLYTMYLQIPNIAFKIIVLQQCLLQFLIHQSISFDHPLVLSYDRRKNGEEWLRGIIKSAVLSSPSNVISLVWCFKRLRTMSENLPRSSRISSAFSSISCKTWCTRDIQVLDYDSGKEAHICAQRISLKQKTLLFLCRKTSILLSNSHQTHWTVQITASSQILQ